MKAYQFSCDENTIVVWEHREDLAFDEAKKHLAEFGITDDPVLVQVKDIMIDNVIYSSLTD